MIKLRMGLGMGMGVFLLAASVAGAQVGHEPAKSPFLEVEQRHELTFFGGYFSAKRDPAKVAPQSAPMGGLLYEWRASGPVNLGLSMMMANSQRTTLDPAKSIATRDLGTKSEPIFGADAFMSVALTGERSWHHLMPMAGAGLGLVTNLKGADVGGFRFGTRFAFPWGAGVRWIPGSGRLSLRADVKDWMYTIKYPQAYYSSTVSGENAILAPGTPTSRWTHNFAMTVGGSLSFKR
jgi:hypothetical protein